MIAPLFILAGLAACGVPIALHFLRPKPRRIIPFPTLRFLRPAAQRESRRHKVLRWLVLALRCLALLLLGLAFARPLFNQTHPGSGQAVVVVVDHSFSMQTTDRQRELTEWALKQVDDLRSDANAGILLAQERPQWAVPFGSPLSTVRAELRNQKPGYENGGYRSAIRLAAERLRESPARERRLVLLGDHQELAWQEVDFDQPLPAGIQLTLPPTPKSPVSQIALTKIEVLESNKDRSAVVSIMPYAVTEAAHTVTLRVDGEVFETQTLQLMPGQAARVAFNLPEDSDPNWLEASIDSDDLPADNSIYTVLRKQQIDLQLTPANENVDYLAIAIDAGSRTNQRPMQVVDWPEDEWPNENTAVLRGESAFQGAELAKLDRFLSRGGRAIMFYDGGTSQKEWLRSHGIDTAPVETSASGTDRPLSLRDWDLAHPSMIPFVDSDITPLLQLRFEEGQSLSPEQVWPIARWPDRTVALAEANILGGTVVIAGFEAGSSSTLVRSASFLPLVHGLASWLSGQEETAENLSTGSVLQLSSAGQWQAMAGPDSGHSTTVGGHIQLTTPGVFQFRGENGERLFYAVNVPTQESDLRPWVTTSDFARLQDRESSPQNQAQLLSTSESSTFAWWALALAIVLIVAEVRLSNQTAR
ncbi:BatA domain-containing protein [Puniceicoccus vermicola]|uniref:BatA domain-containing protein n=1 Tax=Puniceicoccus vermicola TaxID=388746 RepID=A0A7X1B2T4_9BACT|nr:BatA domain-containing protein [Puniceicoccus vermicola]